MLSVGMKSPKVPIGGLKAEAIAGTKPSDLIIKIWKTE
jgi:hypothetical protein